LTEKKQPEVANYTNKFLFSPVARLQGLGGQNTFLGPRFLFLLYVQKTNFSVHKNFGGNPRMSPSGLGPVHSIDLHCNMEHFLSFAVNSFLTNNLFRGHFSTVVVKHEQAVGVIIGQDSNPDRCSFSQHTCWVTMSSNNCRNKRGSFE